MDFISGGGTPPSSINNFLESSTSLARGGSDDQKRNKEYEQNQLHECIQGIFDTLPSIQQALREGTLGQEYSIILLESAKNFFQTIGTIGEKILSPTSAESAPSTVIEKRQESLLSTKTQVYVKDIVEKISSIKILEGKVLADENLSDLHRLSKELVGMVNLFLQTQFKASFQIRQKKSEAKKKSGKPADIFNALTNINNFFQQANSLTNLKSTWSKKELTSLTEDIRTFISAVNSLQGNHLPSIILSQETKISIFSNQTSPVDVNLIFSTEEQHQKWKIVKQGVNSYFKENILINFHQHFNYEHSPILQLINEICPLVGQRSILKSIKQREKSSEKIQENQNKLDQNEIHILEAYQIDLIELAGILKNVTPYASRINQQHKQALEEIFKENHLNLELIPTFFSAISDFITTTYIENYLEPYIVSKISAIKDQHDLVFKRQKEEQETNLICLTYQTLEDSHWERLISLPYLNSDEMIRKLLSGRILIRDGARKTLIPSPQVKQNETDEEKTQKIDSYLPQTEQIISLHLGDPHGTILTKMRQIGYALIQQMPLEGQRSSLSRQKVSVLSMHEQVFTGLSPVIRKVEKKESLTEQEKALLEMIETQLKETNREVIEKHGLKKISKLLFSFHRILNQSFTLGTLSSLTYMLNALYPEMKIISLKGEETSWLYIDLLDNHHIAIEWEITKKIYSESSSDSWHFIQTLRIELPSMDSDELRGKITQKFKVTPVEKLKDLSHDIDQKRKNEREILRRILIIRHVLTAMEFPPDAFIKES